MNVKPASSNVFTFPTKPGSVHPAKTELALVSNNTAPSYLPALCQLVGVFARALPYVEEAFVREDGLEFLLVGSEPSPEGAELAAEFSVALQRTFLPQFDQLLEGGYELRCERPLEGFRRVFKR